MSGSKTEYESFFNVTCVAETAKAIKVRAGEGESAPTVWIPKSVIHAEDTEVLGNGDVGELVVATWFSEKEGLDELL